MTLIRRNGRLTDDLAAAGLPDEFRIWIHPVIKGHGQLLFRPESTAPAELTATTAFDSGVVWLTYRPA